MEDPVGSSNHRSNRTADKAGQTASKIEALFETITDQLSRTEALTVAIPSRRVRSESGDGSPNTMVHFPGRTEAESRKFGKTRTHETQAGINTNSARIMVILQLAHSAVVSGNIFTKR